MRPSATATSNEAMASARAGEPWDTMPAVARGVHGNYCLGRPVTCSPALQLLVTHHRRRAADIQRALPIRCGDRGAATATQAQSRA